MPAARLRRCLAALLSRLVRRRRRCPEAPTLTPKASPLTMESIEAPAPIVAPSAAAASAAVAAAAVGLERDQQPLSFLGLGIVYADMSATSVDASDAAAVKEGEEEKSLRFRVSLVAQDGSGDGCRCGQRLLMHEEIPVPLARCLADCLACGGDGDGPLSEATVHRCPLVASAASSARCWGGAFY